MSDSITRAPRETRTPQQLWEAAGSTLDPTGNYSTRTALIMCSYVLVEEVLAVMTQCGVDAEMGQVRRVSAHGDVLGVKFRLHDEDVLMPMIPLQTTLQVYRYADVQLADPVAEVHAPLPEPEPEPEPEPASKPEEEKKKKKKTAAKPAPWPSTTALAWNLLALLGITPPDTEAAADGQRPAAR
jgi:hypothetical protein